MQIAIFCRIAVGFAAIGALNATVASATTAPHTAKSAFITDLSMLRASVSLPVADRRVWTEMPAAKIEARVRRSTKDPRVEPVLLHLTTGGDDEIRDLSQRLAAPDRAAALTEALGIARSGSQRVEGKIQIRVDADMLGLIDLEKLAKFYARSHHAVKLAPSSPSYPYESTAELLSQVAPYLDSSRTEALRLKFAKNQEIDVESDLLPEFARKMVRRYLVYRGPNCFHAALAFHGQAWTRSSLVNVREEEGYHRAMINFDELWRTLQTAFYEVDPARSPLKYGDVLTFFDVASESPASYRQIRHAAVYLFGGYSFSKGSKSPNTTYTVNTLDEEWNNWRKRVNRLGIKVFRPTPRTIAGRPPSPLEDWRY